MCHQNFIYMNLCVQNQPADQKGQEKDGDQPAAPQGGKPQPLALFFSTGFHGMLFPGKGSSRTRHKPEPPAA